MKLKLNNKSKIIKITKIPQASNPAFTVQEHVYSNYKLSCKNYFLVANIELIEANRRIENIIKYLLFMENFQI